MAGSDEHRLKGRTLGARIAEARTRAGIVNREEFKRRLQAAEPWLSRLAYTSVSDWEKDRNKPRMETLAVIARLTGYTMNELADDPEAVEDPNAVLGENAVAALLGKLGASESLSAAVIAELTAYPPRGGVTREEVVRIHRLLKAGAFKTAEPPENAELDEQLEREGGRKLVDRDLRRSVAKEVSVPAPPSTTKKRSRPG